MALSPTLSSAYTGGKTYVRHLIGMEFINSNLAGGPVRIVDYDQDISVGGNTHTGMAMQISEPELGHEPANDLTANIDATQGQLQYWLNIMNIFDEATIVNVRPFAYNTNTETVIEVVGTYEYNLLKHRINMRQIVVTLGKLSPSNMPFPRILYTQDTHPDLFS